jgi:2-keto-4-pentenoate hydratase
MNRKAIESYLLARSRRPSWTGVPDAHRPGTTDEGYRLQALVHHALGGPIGYKVGSTSAAGQQAFGLSEPVYGGLFEENRTSSLREGLAGPRVEPSVECEIAFVLGENIDPKAPPERLRESVASCHAACEIIDNRYGDPLSVGVPTLLADDFFHARFLLGAANGSWRDLDLARLDAEVLLDGERHAGNSAGVLGAIDSLKWLAGKLAQNGRSLKAGDIVLTGSIVPPVPVHRHPITLELRIEGFEPLTLGAGP